LIFLIPLLSGHPDTTSAATDKTKNQIILELKEEITELGSKPAKRGFKNNSQYIAILEEQLEELKKQKEKDKQLKLAKDKIIKEIEDELIELGVSPVTKVGEHEEEIDKDKDIIALRKQLEKAKKDKAEADEIAAAEKEKNKIIKGIKVELIELGVSPVTKVGEHEEEIDKDKDIIALRKQLEKAKKDKAEADEIATAEKKRAETIVRIKKEIYFLGETPILEFEVETDDEYIAALRKQIEEIKKQKEAEEKEISQSMPEWFIKPPQGSDMLIYVRGTAVSDQIQLALDFATNAALRDLGKKVETRLASKSKETIKQAGIGEDQVSKTEINFISSTVMDEVIVSGYEAVKTKPVTLDNGSYRMYVLLKYPVVKAYKTYLDKIDKSPKLKGRLTQIKNTPAYKELEKAVAQYSGS